MSQKQLNEAWESMCVFKTFTLSKVHTALQHTTRERLKAFITRLEAKGVVERKRDPNDIFEEDYFKVKNFNFDPFSKPIAKHKTVKDTGRQRMWTSMRILRDFDSEQVAMTANVSISAARSYVSQLKKAGYVFVVKKALKTGTAVERAGETTMYRFLKDTGPIRPVPKPNGVFDCNKNELVENLKPKPPVVKGPTFTVGEVHELV